MFDKKGTIVINKNLEINEDDLMELSIELDAEDFIVQEDCFEILTTPEKFAETIKPLEEKGYNVEGELGLIPINMVKVSESDSNSIIKLLELLEDHEDVQKIHSNFEVE